MRKGNSIPDVFWENPDCKRETSRNRKFTFQHGEKAELWFILSISALLPEVLGVNDINKCRFNIEVYISVKK